MFLRYLLLLSLLFLAVLIFGVEQVWADDHEVACQPDPAWRYPFPCPQYDADGVDVRHSRNHLPYPLPKLDVVPLDSPEEKEGIVPFTYAQVVQDDVSVYSNPIEAARGLSPTRRLGMGFLWGSVEGTTDVAGQ